MIITRQFQLLLESRIREKLNNMQVVLGPRQVGKTTGVRCIFDNWSGSKVFATADLPAPPDSQWIIQNWNNARDKRDDVLLVFDEIQKVPRWSETIKMLFDEDRSMKRLRVVLLGSASLSLGLGLNETLSGRFELIRVAHWSFPECQQAFQWTLDDYLQFGGYPAAADFIKDTVRWQEYMRNAIIEPMLARDIFGLVSIKKPALFRQIFELAMHHPAQVLSYQKFLGQLHEPSNVSTIQNYLDILESAFVIKKLPAFSKNIIREKSSSPKILPLCPALVHSFLDPQNVLKDLNWKGRIFELIVGAALCKEFQDVSYWRKGNLEVDYVISINNKIYAIEVKLGSIRKKSALSLFLKEYPDALVRVIERSNYMNFLAKPQSIVEF